MRNSGSRLLQQLSFALALTSLGLLVSGCGSGLLSSTGGGGSSSATVAPRGTQLGYFWNKGDQTLRPVLGIPGSSQIGQSVVPAGVYSTAAASSASETAVLIEPDGSLDIIALPSGTPAHLTNIVPLTAQIRFAPGGQSALLFNPGSVTLTLLTNITATPTATTITSTSAVLDAAIGDSGSVAIASASSSGTGIQVRSKAGAITTVANVSTLGGVSFAAADDLLLADTTTNTLTLIHNASTAPAPSLVPTAALLKSPIALAVAPNGRWAVVANGAEASVVNIDLTAATPPLRIACSCTPALVVPLSGSGTFRVTGPSSDSPMWAIDAGNSTPRAFFIPAAPGMVVKP